MGELRQTTDLIAACSADISRPRVCATDALAIKSNRVVVKLVFMILLWVRPVIMNKDLMRLFPYHYCVEMTMAKCGEDIAIPIRFRPAARGIAMATGMSRLWGHL